MIKPSTLNLDILTAEHRREFAKELQGSVIIISDTEIRAYRDGREQDLGLDVYGPALRFDNGSGIYAVGEDTTEAWGPGAGIRGNNRHDQINMGTATHGRPHLRHNHQKPCAPRYLCQPAGPGFSVRLDHSTLIGLLPPGPPHRRLEEFMAMSAVVRTLRSMRGRVRVLTGHHALQIAVTTRLPAMTVRQAMTRLQRAAELGRAVTEP